MNGILIINKPEGITSQGVVSKIKKILQVKKCGHIGTLDPLATGVLPILVGNCTKISKYLIEHDKIYRAIIKLGEKTSTGDREGKVVENKEIPSDLSEEKVKKVLQEFLGTQIQTPPIYSAIKVNGKKLYEYARENKEVEIPKREIEIYKIDLIKYDKENNTIIFEVECSKGTYIRTLCEDIANKLGTVGFMQNLEREKVSNFALDKSYTLEDVENNRFNLIKMEEIFKDFPSIELNSRKLELFLNGVNLSFDLEDGLYNIYNNQKYVGLGIVTQKLLKRDVIDI